LEWPPGRFVRVRLDGDDYLHFKECEILGEQPNRELRARLIADDARVEQERRAVPVGRNAEVIEIDDFALLVDNDNYHPGIVKVLKSGGYEYSERRLVKAFIQPSDRVIEAGTAVGLLSMTVASIVGAQNIVTFDANPDIVADARGNFRRNDLREIKSHVGILMNRQAIAEESAELVDIYISKEFWASRLNASEGAPDIVKKVKVPVFCLEDEIQSHRACVLICDIEGGEAGLLTRADLSGIKTIIMETHYWSVGEAAIDTMIRKLVLDGFNIHLGYSGQHMVVLRR
jgi:FkbM family methyltransferase